MSSLINKAKDALSRDKGDNPRSDNYGPHGSAAANKVDPRIDSDMDGRNDPTSTYGSSHPQSGGAYTGTTATGSTNAGPHSSNLANKLDPRVDSDRDNRNDPTSRVGGYGAQEDYAATSGGNPAPGGYSSHQQTGYGGSTNAGPHNSNMANKLDPRVDSDMDNRNDPTSRVGGYGTQDTYGAGPGSHVASGGHTAHPQSGYGGEPGYGGESGYGGRSGLAAQSDLPPQPGYNTQPGYGGSTNDGPHNSNLANKLDPRVDSDRDNRNDPTSRVGGYGGQENYGAGQGANPMPSSGHTTHHTTTTTHTQGGYGGDAAGYGQPQGGYEGGAGGYNEPGYGSSATPGSGNAAQTAGPHNSNILNKLDPRVDSDMDGSKTYGGNKTHY